ncbi:MAG: HD domain-containing protein [Planctomycetaceae bacterium]
MTTDSIETNPDLVEKVQAVVAERLQDQQAGHGMDHVLRVFAMARQIQAEVGGDRLTIELASLLHDVGDAKFNHGAERSAEFSREILMAMEVPAPVVDHVVAIVDNISFRKGVAANTLSLEGQVVQDADRLDALGAIGIIRTIEYGAVFGQPFHLPASQKVGNAIDSAAVARPKTGVQHFYDKLFKLRAQLNTAPARRMAEDREKFMKEFLRQFFSECGEWEAAEAVE